jgi:hypothetical protein
VKAGVQRAMYCSRPVIPMGDGARRPSGTARSFVDESRTDDSIGYTLIVVPKV